MSLPHSAWSRHDLGMVVVSLIWGANFTANKYALDTIPPLAFAAARFVLAGALLWLVVRLVSTSPPMSRAAWWRVAALGLIGHTAYQVLFMVGLVSTTAINASLIMAAMPIIVALLGTWSGVERASPRVWVGIAVATVGVVVVIVAQGVRFSAATLGGDLLILGATAAWAAFTVGVRRFGAGLDPLRVLAISTYGGTPALVLLAWGQIRQTDWAGLPAGALGSLAYSTVLSSVVAYVLWSCAVQGIGGTRTAIYNSLVPVVAVVVAWLILGEKLLAAQAGGAVLVFAGVFLSHGSRTRRPALRAGL